MARVVAFSRYFQSIYRDHKDGVIPDGYTSLLPVALENTLSIIQVSVDEVATLLKGVNINKAIGPDKLPNIILKECADALAPSLTTFINFGLQKGFHPTQWKCANLAPVHQKGDNDQVTNYLAITSGIQDPGTLRCLSSCTFHQRLYLLAATWFPIKKVLYVPASPSPS